MGYKWDDVSVTQLAYADDIVLVSESAEGLQNLLNTFVTETCKIGLQVNPAKYGSLAMKVLHKCKKWVVDVRNPLTING